MILPVLPKASISCTYIVYLIGVVSVIYASVSTLRTTDVKELIAYSSVSHAAVYLMGVFSNTIQGIEGGITLGLAHGLVSSGLFICAGGVLYDRSHTRLITYYRGMAQIMPVFSLLFFILSLGNCGVPLTLNFLGEFMSLYGIFERLPLLGIFASSSIILSASYTIFMFNRISFAGPYSKHFRVNLPDINKREFNMLFMLVISTIIFGIYPTPILSGLHYNVSSLIYSSSILTFLVENMENCETLIIANNNIDDLLLFNSYGNITIISYAIVVSVSFIFIYIYLCRINFHRGYAISILQSIVNYLKKKWLLLASMSFLGTTVLLINFAMYKLFISTFMFGSELYLIFPVLSGILAVLRTEIHKNAIGNHEFNLKKALLNFFCVSIFSLLILLLMPYIVDTTITYRDISFSIVGSIGNITSYMSKKPQLLDNIVNLMETPSPAVSQGPNQEVNRSPSQASPGGPNEPNNTSNAASSADTLDIGDARPVLDNPLSKDSRLVIDRLVDMAIIERNNMRERTGKKISPKFGSLPFIDLKQREEVVNCLGQVAAHLHTKPEHHTFKTHYTTSGQPVFPEKLGGLVFTDKSLMKLRGYGSFPENTVWSSVPD